MNEKLIQEAINARNDWVESRDSKAPMAIVIAKGNQLVHAENKLNPEELEEYRHRLRNAVYSE